MKAIEYPGQQEIDEEASISEQLHMTERRVCPYTMYNLHPNPDKPKTRKRPRPPFGYNVEHYKMYWPKYTPKKSRKRPKWPPKPQLPFGPVDRPGKHNVLPKFSVKQTMYIECLLKCVSDDPASDCAKCKIPRKKRMQWVRMLLRLC